MTAATATTPEAEEKPLVLDDIQGNIIRGYRFAEVAHVFGRIDRDTAPRWRAFLRDLLETDGVRIMNAAPWKGPKPEVAINLGISFAGLTRLVPDTVSGADVTATLTEAFPGFSAGMAGRAKLLGDDTTDDEWATWKARHVWIAVHARNDAVLAAQIARLQDRAAKSNVQLEVGLRGHADIDHDGFVREAFGFKDGFSNPVISGDPMLEPSYLPGNCRFDLKSQKWLPIASGEFILGRQNERRVNVLEGKLAPLASILRNGTFAVLRDLEQDVERFHRYVKDCAAAQGQTPEFIADRMMGRTRDGDPLAKPGSGNVFTYGDDKSGSRCPIGSHVRRANPRDTGERRLLRRGMPYRHPRSGASDRQGLYFVAMNASLENQFEFVQGTWLNGPASAMSGASDPVGTSSLAAGNMCIEGDVKSGRPPLLLRGVPAFLTCHGGEYYFIPGMNGLRVMTTEVPRA